MRLGFGASAGLDAMRRARDLVLRDWERLASGRRINRAGDDAAGLAIASALHASERSLRQGVRNLSDGVNLAGTAEGALETSADALVRMRELVVAGGNGALGESGRAAIQAEYDELAEEITRISDATEYGDRPLLDGSLSVQLSDGTGTASTLSVGDQSAQALGVAGLSVGNGATLDAIDAAIASVTGARANLGAAESRLESGIRSLTAQAENVAAARSRIEDTDYAESASDFARHSLLSRAQIATALRSKQLAGGLLPLLP